MSNRTTYSRNGSGPNAEEAPTMSTTHTTEDFLSLRADWKAKGRPADHPYWDLDLPGETEPQCLTGLVSDEDVARAAAMAPVFRAASDANVDAMMRRCR